MTKINKPAYLKKEQLIPVGIAVGKNLPAEKLKQCAEKLRQVLMDPNQKPVMEVFIELE